MRQGHLGAEKDQHGGKPCAQITKFSNGARQQEIEGAQSKHSKNSATVGDKRVPGHGKNGRYGVRGKEQVRDLDHDESDKKRCREKPAVAPQEEGVALVFLRDGKELVGQT